MKFIKKFFNNFEEFLVVPIMAVMTVVVIMQVFCRFVLRDSLSWSEELARYLMVWAVFIGASIGVKRGSHVGVEALVIRLPKRAQIIFKYLGLVIVLVFCAIVLFYGLGILRRQITGHQVSPAMRMPMWWAYLAIPTGALLMGIRFIQNLIKTKRKAETRG